MAVSTSQMESLVEDLSGNLDDLELSLAPLLKQALSSTTSRLPLLDKAKVYVLATYAIESLLFSYLRLNGVDAKEHAVFRELARVKAYFEKLRLAESGPTKPNTTLNKEAAARFIKHGLSGNEQLDRSAAQRQGNNAKRRADDLERTSQWGSANRFESTAKRIQAQDGSTVTVVKASDAEGPPGSSDDRTKAERKAAKRQRREQSAQAKQSPVTEQNADQKQDLATATISEKVHKKKKRKSHHELDR